MVIKSERAKKMAESAVAFKETMLPLMKKYPGMNLWVLVELSDGHVKNLSFFGDVSLFEKIILEAVARLLQGKALGRLETLSVRECEAFLRDRNAEPALEEVPATAEDDFKKVFQWLRAWSSDDTRENYYFSSEKGPFKNLKLVDKVRELKAFLASAPIQQLYQETARPELVDVDDLTVYVQAPYSSEGDRELFHELHLLGVEAFQEDNLNFIPES